jgi:hypothetical protein
MLATLPGVFVTFVSCEVEVVDRRQPGIMLPRTFARFFVHLR